MTILHFWPARCRHNMAPHGRMLSFSQQLCDLQSSIAVDRVNIYDDIVASRCDKQHFYVLIFLLVANLGVGTLDTAMDLFTQTACN